MDVRALIDGLQSGLDTVEKLLPLAGELGGQVGGSVSVIGMAVTQVADNLLQRIEDGIVVAESDDVETIRSIRGDIAAKNDELAKAIASS